MLENVLRTMEREIEAGRAVPVRYKISQGPPPMGVYWGDRPCYWVSMVLSDGTENSGEAFMDLPNARAYAHEWQTWLEREVLRSS